MRRSTLRRNRSGTALVEAAIVTSVFVTLVFGMIDLGITLFRKHVASEAARQGARNASVHGYRAPLGTSMNAWGPTPPYFPPLTGHSLYAGSTCTTVSAGDPSDELAGTITPYLTGVDPSTATITILWPDGNNDVGNRVTVCVTATYQPPVAFLFGDGPISISGSSTMTIMH
jgi:hypothetical protein